MQLNRTRMLGLTLTTAMILAACGTNAPAPSPVLQGGPTQQNPSPSNPAPTPTNPNPTPTPTNPAVDECATVTIDLQGVPMANITVLQSGVVYKSMQVNDNDKIKLPAGTFQIRGEAQNGFVAPNTPASVTLVCGAAGPTALLEYRTATATQVAGVSADLNGNGNLLDDRAFTDELRAAFDYQREVNANKDALLLASQTEEPINVTMIARDSAGNPVPGAVVRVNADSDSVSIFPGHDTTASAAGAARAAGASSPDIIADANGVVRFHVYAVSSVQTGAPPVRFVVNASGGAGSTSSSNAEFKVFFYNISHLILEADGDAFPTGQRVGRVFSTPFGYNFFNPTTARPDTNMFRTLVQPKQPTGAAVPIGGELAPGVVRYDVVSTGDSDDANLELVTNMDGSVSVRPRSGLDQAAFKNGPLDLRIRARYYAQVTFGPVPYEFLLKSYEFDVNYSTPILEVDKTGPQIITWTGYGIDTNRDGDYDDAADVDPWNPTDVTAPQQLVAGMAVGKQYTYDVVVRNTGATTAQNVTARDLLPAELGFVSATVVGRAGAQAAYDEQTHALEVNNIGDLAANESVTVRVVVFARHKPGYAWNDNNRDGNTDALSGAIGSTGYFGERPPIFNQTATGRFVGNTEYSDPYMVKNFAKANAENGAQASDTLEIHVIRPMMELDKTALEDEILTNNTAHYAVTMRNIDRATNEELDPIVRAGYRDLKNRFSAQYAEEGVFYNPVVVDAFGSALANPSFYTRTNGARTVLSTIRFDRGTYGVRLPDIRMGETRTFFVDLRAENVGTGGPERRNCVYLYGWNLNQPGAQLTGPVLSAIPGLPGPFPALAPQYETFDPETGEFIAQAPATSPLFDGRNYLADCEDISIFREDITFDSKLYDSVANNGNSAEVTPFQQVAEELFNARLTDTFRVGDNFEYNFRQLHEGTTPASDVVLTLRLPSMASIATLRDWQFVFGNNVLGTATINLFATVDPEDLINAGTDTVTLGGGKIARITRSGDGHTITININRMDRGDFVLGNLVMNAVTVGSGKLSMGLSYYTVNPGSTTTTLEEELTRVVPND